MQSWGRRAEVRCVWLLFAIQRQKGAAHSGVCGCFSPTAESVGVNSSFCLFRLIFEHRLLHLNNFFFSLAVYFVFIGHYRVLMMTSGVPTKFFLWWELQVLKMRGRLVRLEVCFSVGWLRENCWGSYSNRSFGTSRVCTCLCSHDGLREIESCYSLLDLLARDLLQSGQIRTFLWSTALMTHARPFGLIISV